MNTVMIFFTYLGDWRVIFGLGAVAVLILGLLRKKREIIFFVAILISGAIIKEFIKLLVKRPRPDASFALIPEDGYAFPSGHALMSVIFYGTLCYFIYRACKNKRQKIILLIAAAILVFLIGFSRIYLGVHRPSDVIAGWLIGFSILTFFYYRLKNRQYYWRKSFL